MPEGKREAEKIQQLSRSARGRTRREDRTSVSQSHKCLQALNECGKSTWPHRHIETIFLRPAWRERIAHYAVKVWSVQDSQHELAKDVLLARSSLAGYENTILGIVKAAVEVEANKTETVGQPQSPGHIL